MLWKSREISGRAQASGAGKDRNFQTYKPLWRALDFRGDILGLVLDTSVSNGEKIEELNAAITVRLFKSSEDSRSAHICYQEWKKSGASARDQFQAFQHLRDATDGVVSCFAEVEQQDARGAEAKLRAEIEQFTTEIKEIGAKIPSSVISCKCIIS